MINRRKNFLTKSNKQVLNMVEAKYPYRQENGLPEPQQIEFLNLAFTRYLHLRHALKNPNPSNTQEQKFYYIKELISVYNELEMFPNIKSSLFSKHVDNPILRFGPLFKAIRNLVSHFPFFYSWDEVKFNRELVTCMKPKNLTIDRYFANEKGYLELPFRFVDQSTGRQIEGEIFAPKGYNNNDTVYLKDILCLQDAITLIVGYSHMVLSTCMIENHLEIFEVKGE